MTVTVTLTNGPCVHFVIECIQIGARRLNRSERNSRDTGPGITCDLFEHFGIQSLRNHPESVIVTVTVTL